MPEITESGFLFGLPDNRYFQFENCNNYRTELASHSIKEMDFAWVDGNSTRLFVMEVKFFIEEGATEFDRDKQVERLQKKIIDTVLMLAGVWLGTDTGKQLLRDIQQTCPEFPTTTPEEIKPVLAIGIDRNDVSMLLNGVITDIRQNLKGVCKLFDIPEIIFVALQTDEKLSQPIPIEPVAS